MAIGVVPAPPNRCAVSPAATGLDVVMITGDNARTAAAIARRTGVSRAIEAADITLILQLCRSDFDRLFGQAPFEHAVGEADRSPPVGGEQAHRFMGEHAVGTTAVGHDLGVGG